MDGESWRERGRIEALGTEQYDPIVENEFLPATEHPLSTFSVDVDTAAYANVRRFLNEGRLPPPAAVRIEEMVNYFKYNYPAPEGDVPFSVNMEVAGCPWNGDHRLVRVGIKGQEVERDQRGPSNLVFLLDVSGSMRDANKLPLVRQAMTMLVDQLTEDDRVAIVTYAGDTQVKLESTCGDQREKILAAIDGLTAGGSTHGSAGIQLAYERAMSHFVEEGTNRVILASDGDLNVGITEDDELVRLIQEKARSGVFLTVLGFGTGNLKDSKLEKLADKGNGTYAYIDGLREARKVLIEQIAGSLVTIAKDVKIQIELNPAQVQSYRLIGYENRLLAAPDFHDDKKDAGEIGAGHTVTALYEFIPADGKQAAGGEQAGLKYQRVPERPLTDKAHSGELLTLKLRYKAPDGEKSRLLEFTLKDQGKRFGEASADFRFASAVASFGMVLHGSKHCGEATLSAVEEFAAGAVGDDPGGYRTELVDLVRRAKQLRPR
jgi:Ca-activated chloride channel family protein